MLLWRDSGGCRTGSLLPVSSRLWVFACRTQAQISPRCAPVPFRVASTYSRESRGSVLVKQTPFHLPA